MRYYNDHNGINLSCYYSPLITFDNHNLPSNDHFWQNPLWHLGVASSLGSRPCVASSAKSWERSGSGLKSLNIQFSIQCPMTVPQSFNAGGPCVKWPDLSSTTAPEWCESGPQNLQTQMKSNLNWQELTWIFNYDNINRMIIQVTSIIQVNSMRKLTSIE